MMIMRGTKSPDISKYNNTRYGLFAKEFMSCRKEQCPYYKDVCWANVWVGEAFKDYPINEPCILECIIYNQTKEEMSKIIDDPYLIEEYGRASVKSNRVARYLSLNSDIGFKNDEYSCRQYAKCNSIQNKLFKLDKKIYNMGHR